MCVGGVAYSTQLSLLTVVFLGYSGLFLADLVRPWALLLALESVAWPCFSLQGSFPGPGCYVLAEAALLFGKV